MAKKKSTKALAASGHVNGNGHAVNGAGLGLPIFPAEANQLAVLRAVLRLYDDMIIQDRYDIAGQVVDSYLVDPLDIAMRLTGLSVSTGPLPKNTLFLQMRGGGKRIGVLVEPAVWTVRISGEKKPRRVPLPAMVFTGQEMSYHLWALAGDGWPAAETGLFNAPCSNVSDYGVCRGNVPFPVAAPDTIWQAWGLFIESEFNKHLDNGKSKKHPAAILEMWRELHKAKAAEYPVGDLVPANRTLADIINE